MLIRCSSLSKIMTEPKTKAEGLLSKGAKTYLTGLAKEVVYGYREEIKAVYVNSAGGVTIRTKSQIVSFEPIEAARLAASLKAAASDALESLKNEIANAASNHYPDIIGGGIFDALGLSIF